VSLLLRVGDRLQNRGDALAAMHSATAAIFASAVVVGLIVTLGAAIESRRTISPSTGRRIRRGLGMLAIATLLAVIAGGWAAAGNPAARVRHAWDTFKSQGGYAANSPGNRLIGGLGSGRYDFYRVALDEFLAHPLVGIGADNFAQQYLAHGRNRSTPHYPHSVELRTLSQTGLVGVVLALLGLGAALVAASRAISRSDPLGRAVAAAALAGFAYWAVQGSVDWFWEFAGLGAPAFALLGLACALASPSLLPRLVRRSSSRAPRVGVAVGVLVALAAAVSLAALWLSQLEVQSAARIWSRAPMRAYARLNDAAQMDPLSDEAYLVAGSIALRFGDLARADHEFALALRCVPGDAYATLERGGIASARGDHASALELLERATRLNPRDPLTREALLVVREGRRVNVEALNRSILLNAQQLM
jgi:tetratricopeptide (TPR) repeat protein